MTCAAAAEARDFRLLGPLLGNGTLTEIQPDEVRLRELLILVRGAQAFAQRVQAIHDYLGHRIPELESQQYREHHCWTPRSVPLLWREGDVLLRPRREPAFAEVLLGVRKDRIFRSLLRVTHDVSARNVGARVLAFSGSHAFHGQVISVKALQNGNEATVRISGTKDTALTRRVQYEKTQ